MDSKTSGWTGLVVAAALIIGAGLVVYWNTFDAPLIYDDFTCVRDNPFIRNLGDLPQVLSLQPERGMERRPVVQLTFAVNYAIANFFTHDGLTVLGYHIVNFAIHIFAALTLFAIVRRTLLTPGLRDRLGAHATPLALVVALIWLVHPLQTESVTYITQRIESLMGLLFLLTLYCAIRGSEPGGRGWLVGSVVLCAVGMATKERMAAAPIIVLLYDRTFLAGTFLEALRRRDAFYAGLASTWLVLGALLYFGPKSIAIGLGWGLTPLEYARLQVPTVLHYLGLCFWPNPLILDYGHPAPPALSQIIPSLVLLSTLLAATVIAMVRWPRWGFLGAWFFIVLAPSSSFVPVREPIEEHQVYLSLAAVAALAVFGVYFGVRAVLRRPATGDHTRAAAGWTIGVVLAAACVVTLGAAARARNADYQDEKVMWEKTLVYQQDNPRIHLNLGKVLLDLAQAPRSDPKLFDEAVNHLKAAIEIDPNYTAAYINLGSAYVRTGRLNDAFRCLNTAVNLEPNSAPAQYNLGVAYLSVKDLDAAIECFKKTIACDPNYVYAYNNVGRALMERGRIQEATPYLIQAVKLEPRYINAINNLGQNFAMQGRYADAVACFRNVIELDAGVLDAYENECSVLAEMGNMAEAATVARAGLAKADAAQRTRDADELRARLKCYEAGKPWYRPASGN